jgi:hypothetical protein
MLASGFDFVYRNKNCQDSSEFSYKTRQGFGKMHGRNTQKLRERLYFTVLSGSGKKIA